MLAVHQSMGSSPVSRDFWKMAVKAGAISLAVSLSILFGTLSRPLVLLTCNLERRFVTPSALMVMILADG